MSERARVAMLRGLFARDAPGVRVGIGDDAAVLALGAVAGGGELVWTIDAQVDGTHFRHDLLSWEDIGWRSFMAAASDLAAMGAEPVAALSALALGPSVDDAALEALAHGQAAAADALGCPVVGGNLARATETSVTTTLLGRAATPLLRTGARAGDGVWLAGPVGLAGAGFALLDARPSERGPAFAAEAAHAACVHAWRRPNARIAEGRAMVGVAHAAIDVSDGLALDAWHVAEASGVSLVLDAIALLACVGDDLARAASVLGRDPIDLALHGGEDYALLAASPSPLDGFCRIGSVEAAAAPGGQAGAPRVLLRTSRGTHAIEPRGFDHFAG